MGKIIDCFKRNNIDIDMHVNNKHPDYAPLPIWWIHIMVASDLSLVATTTFKILQGHHVTVTMQRTCLVSMQTSLLYAMVRDGNLSPTEAASLDDLEWLLLEFRLLSVFIPKSKDIIMKHGLLVMEKLGNIGVPEFKLLVKDVANLYIGSATGVCSVVAERNVANDSGKALPPVFPHQLVFLTHS